MNNLHKRAIHFLQKRFRRAIVSNQESGLTNNNTGELIKNFHSMIALDPDSGVKQRLIAVPNFGLNGETAHFAETMDDLIENIARRGWVSLGNANLPDGNEINTNQMIYSPKILIYTNKLCVPYSDVLRIFQRYGHLIELFDEEIMHSTLFISYGSPDENYASVINNFLKSHGVKTWFFPDDALPGQKLHRAMHDGVNNYDRVLLICSKNSLCRPGVLNELERVLEREAREGGKEILMPITLNDHVFQNWAPDRPDLADQVRSRVITRFPESSELTTEFNDVARKLITALKIRS